MIILFGPVVTLTCLLASIHFVNKGVRGADEGFAFMALFFGLTTLIFGMMK